MTPHDPSIHREIWDANADCWDSAIGESGNSFYRHLVAPTALKLLSPIPGENILELACGNGLFSRRLAGLGAKVLATDFSRAMIEKARVRSEGVEDVAYMQLDITSERELDGLVALSSKHAGFDAVVCNMALMDVASLEEVAGALGRLMKDRGRFVVTVMHPAFNSAGGANRHVAASEDPVTGRYAPRYSVNVERYLDIPPTRGEAIVGQVQAQWYFHRPINALLKPFFEAGLVMDAVEEPAFAEGKQGRVDEFSWRNFTQIPPVIGFRLRKGQDMG